MRTRMTRHSLTATVAVRGTVTQTAVAHPWGRRVSRPVMTTPLLSVVIVLALTLTALGQNDLSARATLPGLAGVNVVIEALPLELEAERAGLTRAAVHADTEAQLREAGIHVLNDTEWQTAPGQPWLLVRIRTMRPTSTMSVNVYVIPVDLMQRTVLARDPSIHAVGMTWTTGEMGTVVGNNLSRVRESVRTQVDTFVSAYSAVNRTP